MLSLVLGLSPLLHLPGVLSSFVGVTAVIALLLLLLRLAVVFYCFAQRMSCCGTADFLCNSGSAVGCMVPGTY